MLGHLDDKYDVEFTIPEAFFSRSMPFATLTLEIHTSVPVYLKPGMGIIQIIFHKLSSKAQVGYDERHDSHYVGLDAPRP